MPMIVAKADDVCKRSRSEYKLPDAELQELAEQFNVNTCDGCDEWFEKETLPEHVTIRTEEEVFADLFLD